MCITQQSLLDFSRERRRPRSPEALAKQKAATQKQEKDDCTRVGLRWPAVLPKRLGAGRPTHLWKWHTAVAKAIRDGNLPNTITVALDQKQEKARKCKAEVRPNPSGHMRFSPFRPTLSSRRNLRAGFPWVQVQLLRFSRRRRRTLGSPSMASLRSGCTPSCATLSAEQREGEDSWRTRLCDPWCPLATGWSTKGERSQFATPRTQAASVIVIMSPNADFVLKAQVIYHGSTHAVRPSCAVPPNMRVCHSKSRWQTDETMRELTDFVDECVQAYALCGSRSRQTSPYSLWAECAGCLRTLSG